MSSMELERSRIVGWGADLRREDRPGVPEELDPPRPLGNAHWSVPERQTGGRVAAQSATRPVTPVYGTTLPPRGLSGVLRRIAYRSPEYHARRWLMLMVADRIDVLEHNLPRAALLFGAIAFGALGMRAVRQRRRVRVVWRAVVWRALFG